MRELNNHPIKVYLLIPVYWCVLLLWQSFRPVANRGLIDVVFKILFLLTIMAYIIIKSLRNKISLIKVILLIIFALSQVITLLQNHDILNMSFLIDPLFCILLSFIFLIMLADYKINTMEMIIYSKFIIIMDVIFCLYTDLFRFQAIIKALHTNSAYISAITSFLSSNHEFGLYLCFGIASCAFCIMNQSGKVPHYYILIAFFSIHILLTFSRTSLAAILISGIIVVLKRKKHLLLYLIIALALGFIIAFNPQINSYVFDIILRTNNNAGRNQLLLSGTHLFLSGNPFHILFGIGYSNTIYYAKQIVGNQSFHNAYISLLLNGGIIMMSFFLIIVITSIIHSIKCIKINKNAGIYMIMTLIIALIYMCAQTPLIFSSDLLSFMLTSFTFIIPKYYYNYILTQKQIVSKSGQ